MRKYGIHSDWDLSFNDSTSKISDNFDPKKLTYKDCEKNICEDVHIQIWLKYNFLEFFNHNGH